MFDSIGYQFNLSMAAEGSELIYLLAHLILITRICNVSSPFDGVTVEFPATLRADTCRAKRLGF